ncbi:hypothetical protein T190130A13A_50280 [Tenacibaculum sp. 190130A14a]
MCFIATNVNEFFGIVFVGFKETINYEKLFTTHSKTLPRRLVKNDT